MSENAVKKARIDKGWTQSELAGKANVGLASISKTENNKPINDLMKSRIAKALDLSVNELFNEGV